MDPGAALDEAQTLLDDCNRDYVAARRAFDEAQATLSYNSQKVKAARDLFKQRLYQKILAEGKQPSAELAYWMQFHAPKVARTPEE